MCLYKVHTSHGNVEEERESDIHLPVIRSRDEWILIIYHLVIFGAISA